MAINREVRKLERELQTLIDQLLSQSDSRLVAAYARGWDVIRNEIELLAQVLAEAAAEGTLTRTKLLRDRRVQQGLEAFARAMQTALGDMVGSAAITQIVEASVAASVAMVGAQLTGVKRAALRASLQQASPAQIAAIIERTTQQITTLSWPLADEARESMLRQLVRGVTFGRNPRDAARDMVRGIEDAWANSLSRAMTIARTEMLDAHRTAAQQTEQANADVLAGWQWLTHLDARTCRSCIAMHGTRHDLAEPGPTDHQNGRCARVPVTKTWAELGFPGIEDAAPMIDDADEWFERLTEAEQRAILTDRGFEAWQAGDYPREKWTTTRSTEGWRDSQIPSRPPV